MLIGFAFVLSLVTATTPSADVTVDNRSSAISSRIVVDHGSGFGLHTGERSVVVTAGHVAEAQRHCGNHDEDWQSSRIFDLAIRELDGDETAIMTPDWGFVEEGEILEYSTRRGVGSAEVLSVSESGRFMLDAEVCEGDSGSPVVDDFGHAVGVIVARVGYTRAGCGRPAVVEPIAGLQTIFGMNDRRLERAEKNRVLPQAPPNQSSQTQRRRRARLSHRRNSRRNRQVR
jgi:hypothetical protein